MRPKPSQFRSTLSGCFQTNYTIFHDMIFIKLLLYVYVFHELCAFLSIQGIFLWLKEKKEPFNNIYSNIEIAMLCRYCDSSELRLLTMTNIFPFHQLKFIFLVLFALKSRTLARFWFSPKEVSPYLCTRVIKDSRTVSFRHFVR